MMRGDLVLDLIRTRNVVAASAVVALILVSRILLGNRRSAWVVLFLGVLAVALGYALTRSGG
jgi:hypothetical protein